MSERKTGIPRTNLYYQLNTFRWNIRDSVFDQMDWGLYCSSLDTVDAVIHRATYISLDAYCIIDIMKQI